MMTLMKALFVYFRLPRKTDMERYVSYFKSYLCFLIIITSPERCLTPINWSFGFLLCRKIEIVQFASRTRQLFVRLLALVKWASNAGKVEKCAVRPSGKSL